MHMKHRRKSDCQAVSPPLVQTLAVFVCTFLYLFLPTTAFLNLNLDSQQHTPERTHIHRVHNQTAAWKTLSFLGVFSDTMDKAQKLIQDTSSAFQTVVGTPSFGTAGLATENVQPLAAAIFSKTTELVKA